MKINDRILSIPPYISTIWHNVYSLHMKENVLIITLMEGEPIHIPNLPGAVIEKIFDAHAQFVEVNHEEESRLLGQLPGVESLLPEPKSPFQSQNLAHMPPEAPLRFDFGALDNMGSAMQHNPAQAAMPELPKEILNKIAAISQIIAPEDAAALPQPIAHCNCVFCQVARAIHKGKPLEESHEEPVAEHEESVADEELKFQQWEIAQIGDKLFSVINKLDQSEKYSVYLGHPVGCTCGKQGCEHILAILQS